MIYHFTNFIINRSEYIMIDENNINERIKVLDSDIVKVREQINH